MALLALARLRLSNIALLLNNFSYSQSAGFWTGLLGVGGGWRMRQAGEAASLANPSPSEPKN